MHFRFAWSANLVHASWNLKETMARTRVYRVSTLYYGDVDQGHSTIFSGKRRIEPRLFHLGDADPGPSTGTVEAQAPVFTRVQQARKAFSG